MILANKYSDFTEQFWAEHNAEQAEHIARLEVYNDIWFIISMVWLILLLAGMIVCAVKLASTAKKLAIDSDKKLSLTCEKCGVEFELPREYFAEHPLIPQKKLRAAVPGIGLTVRHARKLTCPICNEESWCYMNKANNFASSMEIFAVALKKCIPFIIAEGGIFVLGGIILTVMELIKRML